MSIQEIYDNLNDEEKQTFQIENELITFSDIQADFNANIDGTFQACPSCRSIEFNDSECLYSCYNRCEDNNICEICDSLDKCSKFINGKAIIKNKLFCKKCQVCSSCNKKLEIIYAQRDREFYDKTHSFCEDCIIKIYNYTFNKKEDIVGIIVGKHMFYKQSKKYISETCEDEEFDDIFYGIGKLKDITISYIYYNNINNYKTLCLNYPLLFKSEKIGYIIDSIR